MWQDIRYAVRTWSSRPAAALAIVITLALGIGASASIFTAVDALLLRPLPFPSPEQLVDVTHGPIRFTRQPMVRPSFVELPEIAAAGVWQPGGVNLELGLESHRVNAAVVDDGFFHALGVPALIGNVLPPSDGVSRTAVVSHALWRTRLGGDRALIGRAISINGHPYTVTGVMPPAFAFPSGADLWIPPMLDTQATGAAFGPEVIARLAPGVSLAQASAAVDAYEAQVRRENGRPAPTPEDTIILEPLADQLTRGSRATLVLLAASVALLLVVVCASVANILLARVASRARELRVRRALGASRWRLVRQTAIESLVLSSAGGIAGVLVATSSLSSLRALVPSTLGDAGLGSVDARLLIVAVGVALISALLLSVAPGVVVSSQPAADVVRSGRGDSGGRGWRRVRSSLIVGQMALALVLLSASTAAMGTLLRVSGLDLGFGGTQAVAAQVTLPLARYGTNAAIVGYMDRAIAQVGAAAGVKRVAVTGPLPGDTAMGVGFSARVAGAPVNPDQPAPSASMLMASPDYFTVMGIRLLSGRGIAAGDRQGSPPVVVFSEGYARRLFSSPEAAVGAKVDIKFGPTSTTYEVVGVVANVYMRGTEADARGLSQMYFAAAQNPPYGVVSVVAEIDGDAAAGVSAIREALATVDSTVPTYGVRTLDAIVDQYLAAHRVTGTLVSGFAIVTLLVAAVGLYGLMAQVVAERRREIGIRLALGATGGDVRWSLVGKGVVLTGIGAVIGAAGAAAALQALGSVVPSLQSVSPIALMAQAIVLLATGMLAAWWPASRVLAIDPATVLRDENN